ncbi:hypothetical protein K8S19_12165 [bacterium]|nr:hypothetical protein [bacterium]
MKYSRIAIVFFLLTIVSSSVSVSAAKPNERLLVTTRYSMSVQMFGVDDYYEILESKLNHTLAHIIVANGDRLYFINPLFVNIHDRHSLKELGDIEYDGVITPGLSKAVIAPDVQKLYVGVISWDDVNPSGIFVLDLKKNKQIKILLKNSLETGFLDITKDGKYVYAAEYNCLKKISTQTDQIEKTFYITAGERIHDIVVIDEETIYLVIYKYDPYDNKTTRSQYRLVVFNAKNGSMDHIQLETIKKIRKIAILKDGYLYVAGDGQLAKINIGNHTVVKTYSMGFKGYNAGLSNGGKKIFVSSSTSGEVVVLDVETGNILKRISIDGDPYDIFVD